MRALLGTCNAHCCENVGMGILRGMHAASGEAAAPPAGRAQRCTCPAHHHTPAGPITCMAAKAGEPDPARAAAGRSTLLDTTSCPCKLPAACVPTPRVLSGAQTLG